MHCKHGNQLNLNHTQQQQILDFMGNRLGVIVPGFEHVQIQNNFTMTS